MSSVRGGPVGALDGCRVLVLEDEYFLADDLANGLSALGAKIVGPISDLRTAQDEVSHGDFDVAVMDVKLRDEFIWSIADTRASDRRRRLLFAVEIPRRGTCRHRDELRRTGCYDAAALVSCAGPDVDDPIAGGGQRHIMLHQDDGVAGVD